MSLHKGHCSQHKNNTVCSFPDAWHLSVGAYLQACTSRNLENNSNTFQICHFHVKACYAAGTAASVLLVSMLALPLPFSDGRVNNYFSYYDFVQKHQACRTHVKGRLGIRREPSGAGPQAWEPVMPRCSSVPQLPTLSKWLKVERDGGTCGFIMNGRWGELRKRAT